MYQLAVGGSTGSSFSSFFPNAGIDLIERSFEDCGLELISIMYVSSK